MLRTREHPYRTIAVPCSHAEAKDIDPTRRQRRLGVALAAASFALMIGVVPLAVACSALVTPGVAATCFLATLFVQVLLALSSAHILFVARQNDRTRGQTLCSWFGAAAVVLAALGVLAAAAATLLVWVIMSLGPWCGVCGT